MTFQGLSKYSAELDLRAALRGVKRQEATPTAVALANDTIAALNSTDLGAATVTTAAAVLNATAVTVTQTVTVTDLASAKNGTAKGDKKKDKGKGKDKKGKKGGKKDAEKNGTAKATEAADAGVCHLIR